MAQTETQIQTQSLRERVAEARLALDRDKLNADAEAARRNRKSLKEMLSERLGVEVEESAITMLNEWAPMVEVEGFRFSIASDTGDLALLITCGACGKEYERVIWSMTGMADTFVPYPHADGYCVEREQSPTSLTTELRLLQALRDFIAEQNYQGE